MHLRSWPGFSELHGCPFFFIQQHINIKNDLGSKWRTIENLLRKLDILARVLILFRQEPITRSVQFPCFRATAFSQAGLFLDMPFPLKLLFLVTSASKSEYTRCWRNSVVFATVICFPLVVFHHSSNWSSHNSMRFICTLHMCKVKQRHTFDTFLSV